MKKCSVESCERKHSAKGFCAYHYQNNKRHGNPLWKPIEYIGCSVSGCEGEYHANGLCKKHNWRYKKNGDPNIVKHEYHGLRDAPEYHSWKGIIQRCENPNSSGWARYGGRGIRMCERWRNSFSAFLEDMGERPFPKAQVDRIDNDGNYEPGNCIWTTNKENSRHSTRSKLNYQKAEAIRDMADIMTPMKLAGIYGVSKSCIRDVINGVSWS